MPRSAPPLLAVVVTVTALATSCGGGGAASDDPGIEARVAGADLDVGAGVYGDICAACHGPDGQGGIGPGLVGVADRISVTETHGIVTAGEGRMPAWGNRLEADEVDAVVAHVRQAFG